VIVTSLDPVRIDEGDLWVESGKIAAPGHGRRVETDGLLVLPGNVCAHTHLYSALARGMPYTLEPPRTFLQILQRIWWRLDRALDQETIRASALAGGMEALLSGTTTVIDHHASPNAIDGSLEVVEDALRSLGLRHVLCYETSDRDGPERAAAGIAENRRFLHRIRRECPVLTRALVGAHASFTLSEETLAACIEVGPLHVHAAEDGVDCGAVARLAAAGALTGETLLAHGVHLGPDELRLVRAAGATVAHNARSNMNNGVGRPRVDAFERLALGTDGIGSDMFEESRTAYFHVHDDGLGAAADWALERMAESARLAGRLFEAPLLGTLAPGAPADLVVLDYPAPAPVRESSFAGHWIFGLSARHVRDVMVAGEWVVRDRRLALVDQDELAASASVQADRLWRRLAEIPAHEFEPSWSPAWGRSWPAERKPSSSRTQEAPI
jgi:putative selenium metabolism protein SsnA